MNKEIEEIMLTVPQKIVAYDGNPAGQHLYGEQRQQIAETLYNAGYRKTLSDIERLKTQLQQANAGIVNCIGCYLVELNAVKDFADKLKGKLQDFGDGGEKGAYITEKDINELLKEYEQ